MSKSRPSRSLTSYEISGWVFVVVGLINACIFTYLLHRDGFIQIGEKIILDSAGQLGSFIGALLELVGLWQVSFSFMPH
ncbi:hypothetical protein [Desulfovibrio sp. JC022]|uniref:hypothetical protein n=1 Tax=Desulfovibrio sp. JC022 TaxID=2593642 RepID=UPI0013CF8D11|nr:hypothetical protein [Desulfovibrio sp. JC022]NDV24765.1 hypothetical protein [Desulfovibrio sp. JC022]